MCVLWDASFCGVDLVEIGDIELVMSAGSRRTGGVCYMHV